MLAAANTVLLLATIVNASAQESVRGSEPLPAGAENNSSLHASFDPLLAPGLRGSVDARTANSKGRVDPNSGPSTSSSIGQTSSLSPSAGLALAATREQSPAGDMIAPGGSGATDTPFVYVVDHDLRNFLIDYAREVGLRADIASVVRGRLKRMRLPLDLDHMMAELSRRFDIEWFVEGGVLRVSSRSELVTRILPLHGVSFATLLDQIKSADLDRNSQYPLSKLANSDALTLSAPVIYVARVSALIDTLRTQTRDDSIRIVRFGIRSKGE